MNRGWTLLTAVIIALAAAVYLLAASAQLSALQVLGTIATVALVLTLLLRRVDRLYKKNPYQ